MPPPQQRVGVAVNAHAQLAEGPMWSPRDGLLYWVDIPGRTVHAYNPKTREDRSLVLEYRPCCLARCSSQNCTLLLGTDSGFALLDFENNNTTWLQNPEAQKETRFNDGKCDKRGRFVAGTMSDCKPRKVGAASLYTFWKNNDKWTTNRNDAVGALTVSNGLAWSSDDSIFYHIDTPTRKVRSFHYNIESGEIHGLPKVVIDFDKHPDLQGSPDGMTIDEEGCLWIALFRGGKVTRWDPVSGKLLSTVLLPVPHVTSCCFGGDNLRTLYITTAQAPAGENPGPKAEQAGSVFAVDVGVAGTPLFEFS